MNIPGFDKIFPPEEYADKSKQVKAQKKRLATARAIDFGPTRKPTATQGESTEEQNQKASDTWSEPTRSLQ